MIGLRTYFFQEQVARRRLDEGPSTSDANAEARRLHKIIRWMLVVLREILDDSLLDGTVGRARSCCFSVPVGFGILEFLGLPDPIKAQSWLGEMEKAFELAEVKDDKKAQYASYYLKDEASFWWESSKALLDGNDLSWEKFTEMFLEKYFPSYM
ncbi:hypothetical protein AgCh_024544 [Apium graveolens]